MGVSICFIGGVIAAACGCGDCKEDYGFVRVSEKTLKKSPPVSIRPCCGATVLKTFTSFDDPSGETHHTKRRLAKNQRATIRGMATNGI